MPEITKFYKRNYSTPENCFPVNKPIALQLLFSVLAWIIIVTLIVGCGDNQNKPIINSNSNSKSNSNRESAQGIAETKKLERIISTTPAITELLFEIGLGDKIVGDSAFTLYPPEAAKIEKIGGLYDRNNEKIISLQPDLVVFPFEDVQFDQKLAQYKIGRLAVDHRSISGLLESYELVGKLFGGDYLERARKKRREFEDFLRECKSQSEKLKKLRVLTIIDRQRGTGRIDNVFIAGADLFFSEILSLAGGENVASNLSVPYPNISTEAIIDFNPDVIIDLQVIPEDDKSMEKTLRSDWDTIKELVPAVKRGDIFIITDNYISIPGPRIPLIIKKFRKILDSCREKK
ncbi:MAG: ABC transporter substrate-binding protein [Planctomycetaceae bacterium]|jgi:iron complex transport system substrate-binding protein|nr:ABC transporter substrate-binding protein [Planctomycetaceae bacterium]